jgi:hypothetical protein
LLVLISVLVNVTAVQNFLVKQITRSLSGKFHTEVSIRHVDFQLFDKFVLDGTYIADQDKDTLLYASKLTVNVTNFFFLKNKTYLRYVGLQDAVINLRRQPGDSVWNYQFILDALSPSTPSTGNNQMPNLDIRRVMMDHIRINKLDAWSGQDMHISADHILLNARNIDLRRRRILIRDIRLDHPLFALVNYKSSKPASDSLPASPAPPQKEEVKGGSLQWNNDHWTLQANQITINQGGFALIDKDESHVEKYFDPQHIAFYDIHADLKNTHLAEDSIITDLDLSARERCGLQVKKLACRFKISPVEMEFANLDLVTNQSHLTNYFSMQFTDFSDMNDFVSAVFLRGNFTDARVSSDDIAYFAPALESWKTNIEVKGNAYGPIANITGNNLHIRAGNTTELDGEVSLRGLPDINNTFIDFQADKLMTTGKDIQQFIPDLKEQSSIDLDKLTSIHFTGNYTGFIEDFVAYGDFKTNLGNIHSDINMKFGERHKVPVYSGNIAVQNLDLGTLLNNQTLGTATLEAKIDGSGFKLNDLSAKVDGEVDNITIKDYTYHNIKTQGTFNKKLFNGLLEVADSNLTLNFAGTIDLNDSLPVFKFQSDIANSDLRALNLTKDSITFSGKLDLNLTGNSIDNFLGDARLYDINLYKNKARIAFDTLVVHSKPDSANGKILTLQGNEIQGFLKGRYDLDGLPHAVQLFLSRYYPNKFSPPENKNFYEDFSFGFQLGNADKIIHSFVPDLTGFDNAVISGSMNTYKDALSLEASIPTLGYGHYIFNDVQVQLSGKTSGLGMITNVGEIYTQDSLLLPGTEIKTTSSHDTSYINVKTAGATALNNADLYGRVITLKDGYSIKVLNSELVVNDKIWRITPDNEITLRKNAVTIHNFNISHNEQKITLASNDLKSDTSSFLVKLQNLYISDFSQFFITNPQLEGVANGMIQVDNPLGNMVATANVDASSLRINNDSMGTVHSQVIYNKTASSLDWKLYKNDNPARNFSLKGLVGLSKSNRVLQGDFNLNHTDISTLGSFINAYVSDLKGYATGEVKLGGTTEAPEISGSVKLDSVGMKVNYLGTYYTLSNETINFNPSSIDIGTITLHDMRGNSAVLQGSVTHQHFNNLNFNISLNTRNFQLMHTTAIDNPVYYGDAYGSGRVNLTGPLADLRMTINVSPTEGTHIYLPLSDAKDIGKHDFVIFKQYGKELKKTRPVNDKVNLTVKLYANMNPQAKIDVIVDASSGDRISASGNGALQMNMDLNGDFRMYGNYTITNGNYTFSFKGLIARNFVINQGSTISWNGDPSDANVSISAIYNVPGGANLSDLIAGETDISSSGITKDEARLMTQREKVDVYLTLKGSLGHPDITYDIRLPDASISTSSYIMTKLQQIRQNPNDLINQVAALLAFGQFIPESSGNGNNGLLRSGGLSGAGQWVSSQLSGVLNNLLGNTFRKLGVDFSLNYNAYSTISDNGSLQRNDVQFNLSKSIFNNRVRIEVGPSIDWGRGNNAQATSNSYFAGDFRFEYLITPEGRVRFMAFSRSNYDVLLNTNLTRGGIGISYSRDFDRLHELFLSKQEKKRKDSLRNARINRYLQQNSDADSLSPADRLKKPVPGYPQDSLPLYRSPANTPEKDSTTTKSPSS